ncbi:MAG TPA: hypothetical protein VFV08_07170, partial [Puia sp.]|nr:hypothetical protein [Puia sp.]
NQSILMIKSSLFFLLTIFFFSCNQPATTVTETKPTLAAPDSVRSFVESISRDITQNGPNAWLQYFENSPDFFMASEGKIIFPNYDSADGFIKHTLVKMFTKIELSWTEVKVDVLSSDYASVAATYLENKTNASGVKDTEQGYFTGLAHLQNGKWKLRNAHWSVLNSMPEH